MHIQAQPQDPLAIVGYACLFATIAPLFFVCFFHTSRQFAASAVSCRLISSTLGSATCLTPPASHRSPGASFITPYPTGRLFGAALSQALRAGLRSHRPSG